MAATPGKNPNCRNSELNDPLRRSFSRYPFAKPSVSPGLHRRDTIHRESFASFTDFDDKENREDQNEPTQWRSIRSPVPSKSYKNFMSSTISTASSRKNLLVERNEEEISLDYLKTGLDSMVLKDQSTVDGDLVNLDPTFKISPRVSFSPFVEVWAPVDPDHSPSPPPYDSKVNYLSPRPQFLYYRTNNGIKLGIGNKGPQVEESIQCESSLDMEYSEEQSDDDMELDVPTLSEVTEPNKGNKKLHEFEPFRMRRSNKGVEFVRDKGIAKPASFSSPKFMALLIALAFTYLYISSTDLATFAPLKFEGLNAYNFQIPFKVVKDKFDGYFQRLQYWLANVRSYVLTKISGLGSKHVPIPVMYADLCSLPEYNVIDSNLKFSKPEDRNIEKLEVEANDAYKDTEDDSSVGLKEVLEAEDGETTRFSKPVKNEVGVVHAYEEGGVVYAHHDALIEEQTTDEEEVRGIEARKVEVIDHLLEKETEGKRVHTSEDGGVYVHHDALVEAETTKEEEIRRIEAQKVEVIDHPLENETEEKHEFASDMVSQGCLVLEDMRGGLVSHATELQSKESIAEISFSDPEVQPETTECDSEVFGDQFSRNHIPLISLLVVLLLIVPQIMKLAAFHRKGKPSRTSHAAVPTTEQALQTQKHGLLTKFTTIDHKAIEELPSKGWPSQMSCSEKGSWHKNELFKSSREAHSLIRRPIVSLACSDYSRGGDSPSYGSFTTYERIPNKHGVDEEIATPVRRSSRIRNRIASSS